MEDDNGEITIVFLPPGEEPVDTHSGRSNITKSALERIMDGETYIECKCHTDEEIKEWERMERKLIKISLYVFYAVMFALCIYWAIGVPKLLQMLRMV